MGTRHRKIDVIGVGTPPPLPLGPLVLEILRTLEVKQRSQRQRDQLIDAGQMAPAKPGARGTAWRPKPIVERQLLGQHVAQAVEAPESIRDLEA